MNPAEAFCRTEATRRRVAFVSMDGGALRLELREPAAHVAKALREKGFEAEDEGGFKLAVRASDWEGFWRAAGPLLDCGC